ncbi:MAG TPA: radical SAM protein [Nitrososphaerales archaeon]|nr:radical SAM protein [Nitrososphaerales archaeon]
MFSYVEPLYRPPSEAGSMIFQVTIGCSFNKCSFCDMYRSKEYIERTWKEIEPEINYAAKNFPDTRRIFLADGDALTLSTERLLQILQHLYASFPQLERVSIYAMPKNLLQKSEDELRSLQKAGLTLFYIGIETGSDILLKKVTKGATAKGMIDGCLKAKRAGIDLSCMIILGIGGKTYTEEHARETAHVVSKISPNYLGALTLYLETGVKEEFLTKFGEPFIPLDDPELLDELELLIRNLDAQTPVVFRTNHASNAYMLKGTLPADKDTLLTTIAGLKSHPEISRPKMLRRF